MSDQVEASRHCPISHTLYARRPWLLSLKVPEEQSSIVLRRMMSCISSGSICSSPDISSHATSGV